MSEDNKAQTTSRKKGIYLVMAVIGIVGFLAGGLIGFLAGVGVAENGNGQNQPTTVPKATTMPSTVVDNQPSTTPELEPTHDWLDYIYADCEISLKAPPDWTPGLRGESGTCGSFRIPETGNISNISSLELGIAFLAFANEDSPFSPLQQKKYNSFSAYLNEIDTETKRDDRDLLIEQEQRTINGKEVTYALINTDKHGILNHLFYEVAGEEFMIVWQLENEGEYQVQIDTLFDSIKFL